MKAATGRADGRRALAERTPTTLRLLTGDRADSTMNYRLRDAIIGLLAPHSFDPKGSAAAASS